MTTTAPSADDLDLDKLRSLAARGEAAAAELAAAERERQEQRTAELAAQQQAYDADLTRRGPQADADLEAQRDEALADLQTAVDEGDLSGALQAWRREASARYSQREWRHAWRGAFDRTGDGARPPLEGTREAERDEVLAFLPALAQATESGARLDADRIALTLVGERPTALLGEVLPGPEADLRHAEGCPDPARTEVTHPPVGRGSQGTVVRCVSCQASRVVHLPPPEPEDAVAAAPGPALMRRPTGGEQPARDGWVG